jgi:hypothetical protein
MPVLVGAFGDQVVSFLSSLLGVTPVAKLAPVGTEAISQCRLRVRHAAVRIALRDGQRVEGLLGAPLSYTARVGTYPFERFSQVSAQR